MALQFTTPHLQDSLTLFRSYESLGEGAFTQVSDEQLQATLALEMSVTP